MRPREAPQRFGTIGAFSFMLPGHVREAMSASPGGFPTYREVWKAPTKLGAGWHGKQACMIF